jgi:hypothetical protein
MARPRDQTVYQQILGTLEGSDFQDEVCARLQGHITDFQRIPPKPSGDGGLDGLSHGQERAYCCYGPEQDPVKLKKSALKDDIISKFSADLRKLFELTLVDRKLQVAPNKELGTILGDGNKIKHVYLVVSWFETHRVVGPLNTAFGRYKKVSEHRFIDASATMTIWGPKDLASRAEVDDQTLFRIETRGLQGRVLNATAALLSTEVTGDYDAKFSDLRARQPEKAAHVDALARDLRQAWAAAIALDNQLAATSVGLHEALENARRDAATAARLHSMGTGSPDQLMLEVQRNVVAQLGQNFGQKLGGMTTTIATGVVAGLIGECPLDWRS